ncbi:MAG: AAA family ATPase, partial [Myxococcota bacterium]
MRVSRDRVVLGDRVVDLGWGTIEHGGALERLSPSERVVLQLLVERVGQDVPRDAVCAALGRSLADNALDRLMSRLRARLGGEVPRTVRGVGYRLDPSPAAAPLGSTPSSGLIGRTDELAAVAAAPDRVVVLLGPAGVGKTTLGRALLARSPGWFVELASSSTEDEVLAAVCAALGLPGPDGVALGARLATLDAPVVVLDNAEQCGDALAAWIERWSRSGRARFVVTSRRPLGLPHERRIAVGPLPPADAHALVRQRAADADPTLELDPVWVERIARRAEYVPLAIELATAYLDRMTPSELCARLEGSLGWLEDRGPDRVERHSTLMRAVGWSWALLGPAARDGLAAWSTFRGSFTLADAERLFAPGADALQHLIDASLVRIVAGPRFVLLDAVREFAERQREEHPDRARWVAAWRRWCVDGAGSGSRAERAWNWTAALGGGLDAPDAPELAVHLLDAQSGLSVERRFALADLADRAEGVVRARLLAVRCRIRRYAGLEGYRGDLDQALAEVERLGDRRQIDEIRLERARLAMDDGDLAGAERDLLAAQWHGPSRYQLAALYLDRCRHRSAEGVLLELAARANSEGMRIRAGVQLAVLRSPSDPAGAYRELVALTDAVRDDDPSTTAARPFVYAWRSALSWELGEVVRARGEARVASAELHERSWLVPAAELDAMAALFEPVDQARARLDAIAAPPAGAAAVAVWRAVNEAVRGDPALGVAALAACRPHPGTTAWVLAELARAAVRVRG